MALLNDEIVKNVTDMLADLANDVRLVVFTTEKGCEYCKEIVQLAQEVAATSPKLTAEIYNFDAVPTKAAEFNITMAPAIAIVGARDYGVRYYGIPSGYEFSTLLYAIQRVGKGPVDLDLDPQTMGFLEGLNQPVNLQVFVTPTCPYCPRAAMLAYEMAVASDKVVADVVESMEFQELANRFDVMGVPLSVVNGKERVEGAAPPYMIVNAIQAALA
ncbi:MAG TPA: thioredoxin family protein [Anaerolineae bacterium]|nr:thioredoxin family protein [Anaerolineae bacterium]HQK12534.1 thioredoxin family protein [Anaerolineae bacterium]